MLTFLGMDPCKVPLRETNERSRCEPVQAEHTCTEIEIYLLSMQAGIYLPVL